MVLRLLVFSFFAVGVAAVLLVLTLVGIANLPTILAFADQHFAEAISREFKVKDASPLSSAYYFKEESGVYVGAKERVACFSSPEHRQIVHNGPELDLFEKAILASEDKSFYGHNGVDGLAIVRASIGHLSGALGFRGTSSGASTISMQLAKTLYKDVDGKDAPRTINQKFKEAVTAIRIERAFSKQEIIDRYLNMPYLGRGAYGIEAASKAYFGRSAKDLKLAEVAFLVALINKPALPDRRSAAEENREDARANRWSETILGAQRVLDLAYGAENRSGLSKRAYAEAAIDLEQLKMIPFGSTCSENDSGRYYTEHVRVAHKDALPLNSGGFDIFLPRDDGLQHALMGAVKLTVDTFLARHENDPDNAALRACAYAVQFNGDVLAWVGNVDYKKYKFDACALGWRSPGSTIKPFTYAAKVQKLLAEVMAEPNSPQSIHDAVARVLAKCNVLDAPIGVSLGRGKGIKMIQNFHSNSEPLYRGNISCKQALGESRNAAAMRAGQEGKIKEMIKLIYLLGMPKDAKHIQQAYPTTAIGGSDVQPIGMAGLATFLNGGFQVVPRFTSDICKGGKSVLAVENGKARECDPNGVIRDKPIRLIDPAFAATMAELLRSPVELPTGTVHGLRTGIIPGIDPLSSAVWNMKKDEREKRLIAFPFATSGEIAGKTGTATNADGRTSDVWLLLFVPGPERHPEKGIMLVFWMGKDSKDHPLGERGATGGAGFAESGGRNWTHSAATVLSFLQKERGYLQPGNRFIPIFEDDEFRSFGVRAVSAGDGAAQDNVPLSVGATKKTVVLEKSK